MGNEAKKARSNLYEALCEVLPVALDSDAIHKLLDALDALIVERLAENQQVKL